MKRKTFYLLILMIVTFLLIGCSDSSGYEEGFFTKSKGSYSFVLIADQKTLNNIEAQWTNITSDTIKSLKKQNSDNNFLIAVPDIEYDEIKKILKKHGMEEKEYVMLVYELDKVIFKTDSIKEYKEFVGNL